MANHPNRSKSSREPVLASRMIEVEGERGLCRLIVRGGLHHIRGNHAPYFSLTYDLVSATGCFIAGGAGHDEILKHFPQFRDLAALHLSDIDGVPMHAAENAFYHLGGCTQFRPGSIWAGRGEPYTAKYAVAADHLRITEAEARQLALDLFGDHYSESGGFLSKEAERAGKARLVAWCETQKPRWKAEADAAIAHHSLVVFGDPWPQEEAA